MKKSYKTTMGVFALATVALLGSQMLVSAHGNSQNEQRRGIGYSQEHRNAMTKIFADRDYEAWKEQMQNRGHMDVKNLTPATFATMQQMHQKMLAGDYEGARAMRTELGLEQGRGMGQGQGMGRNHNENRGQNMGGNFVDADGDGTCDHMN